MGCIKILGSAFAIPAEGSENTHLLVQQGKRLVLVDTASNPIQHLHRAEVNLDTLDDIILTHFHPDHVSGVSLLLMDMWLMGRKTPLNLYGLAHTLDRVKTMMDLFDWATWPNFYQINFHVLPEEEKALVLEDETLRIFSSPVKHLIPTIGIRIEFLTEGKAAAYSCDTEPCEQVTRLANGVDVLIHESAGASIGHSSAAQAARIATEAHARALYLIHYSTDPKVQDNLLRDAQEGFSGPVKLARDFMKIPLD